MKTEKKAIVLKTVEEARAYLKKLSVKAKAVEKRLEKSVPEKDDIDLGNPNVDDPEQFEREMKKFDEGIEKFGRQFDKAMSAFDAADKVLGEYRRMIGRYPELRDWFNGSCDKIPGRMIASLAGALIYFISPVDLIPDWIPMAGFLDDAAILAAVFKLSEADIKFYRKWHRKQQSEEDSAETDDEVDVVDV